MLTVHRIFGGKKLLTKKKSQNNQFKKLKEMQCLHTGVNEGNWFLFLCYHYVEKFPRSVPAVIYFSVVLVIYVSLGAR